jgi:hypothetical protein
MRRVLSLVWAIHAIAELHEATIFVFQGGRPCVVLNPQAKDVGPFPHQ